MENLNKRPSKGILRFSESSRSESVEKDIKWDEANIKETLHPDDKDYGHMKIDEPPTPYSRSPHGMSGENSDEEDLEAKTNDLLEKVSKKIKEPPVAIENLEGLLDESDLDAIEKQGAYELMINGGIQQQDADMPAASTSQFPTSSTPNTKGMSDDEESSRVSEKSASDFELKRKRHYNEFYAVKLAKKLLQKEKDDEDDDDDDDNDSDDNWRTNRDDGENY